MWMKTLANGITIHDVNLWLDGLDAGYADRKSGTAYTATNVTKGAAIHDGTEMIFNGSSSKIECGGVGLVKSVIMWVKPTTNTEYLIDLDGTSTISITNGAIATASITSPTVYVNGEARTGVTLGVWNHVVVTWATAIDASDCNLGLIGSSYLEGSMTKVLLLSRSVSQVEAGQMYSQPAYFTYSDSIMQLREVDNLTFAKDYANSQVSTNADWSNGSFVGTVAASRGADNPATYIEKQSQNALLFDGVDDKVIGSAVNLSTGASVQVKYISENVGTNQTLFSSVISSSNRFVISQLSTNLCIGYYNGSSYVSKSYEVSAGVLYNIVGVWNGSTMSLYVNGASASGSTNPAANDTAALSIGSTTSGANLFKGEIYDVKIYGSVLSASDAQTLSNNGSISSSPINHWDFSDGSGATLTDIVGSNNGTISGPKWLTAGSNYIKKEVRDNAPRFTQGFYDTTGFVERKGLIIEGARTNYVTDSIFYKDTNSDGLADGFTIGKTDITAVESLIDVSSICAIPSANAQRIQITEAADNDNYYSFYDSTRSTGFSQGDIVTISAFIKGSYTGMALDFGIFEYDAADGFLTYTSGAAVGTISSTKFTRFTRTLTLQHADVAKIRAEIRLTDVDTTDTADVQIFGFQCELAPYASTFVPTTTAAVTRNEESLKYPISGNRTAASESIYAKFTPFWGSASLSQDAFLLDTETDAGNGYKSVRTFVDDTTDFVQHFPNATDSGGTVAQSTTKPLAYTSYVVSIISNGATSDVNAYLYMDGSSEGTDSDNYTQPVLGTFFTLGSRQDLAVQLDGIIESTAFYSTAHDATTVATVTSILENA